MRMERLSLYVLFAVAIQSLCCAEITKLSTDDRKALQDSERFREIHSTSDLPRPIVALGGGKLAEPGGKWNPTDSIIDPTLPGKRLIWAATAGDCYVVQYERGGIAHTFHVLAAKLAKGEQKAKIVWRAMGGPFKDYGAFVDALRSGKLDDRLDYPH